jgi:ribose 5-phosphate isomerase A
MTRQPPAVRDDPGMAAAAARALELITDGMRVGLGSGRTASVFVRMLGARVRDGLRVTGVPASSATAALATEVGIPLADLADDAVLDLTVDGADEVAPNLDLIKGHGGALVRERIVAAASRRQVIVVGSEKLVRALGERFRLPVEVIPFAAGPVARAAAQLGLTPVTRLRPTVGDPLVNENGNLTLDCALGQPLPDALRARSLEAALLAIPGVVDTGFFLGTAERVLVGHPDGRVDTLVRDRP